MFSDIYPFSEVMRTSRGKRALTTALSLCFLNGGLPQGTPISPMLTNIIMIPIDHKINGMLNQWDGNRFVYTRYADDIIISGKRGFDQGEVIDAITSILKSFRAPYVIKPEKTRYGSRSGANWNLGLMLNKDNEITVGHKRKRRFRAMVTNYLSDRGRGIPWSLEDVQVMAGQISYYAMVEADYVADVVKYNREKYGVDLMCCIKEDLK